MQNDEILAQEKRVRVPLMVSDAAPSTGPIFDIDKLRELGKRDDPQVALAKFQMARDEHMERFRRGEVTADGTPIDRNATEKALADRDARLSDSAPAGLTIAQALADHDERLANAWKHR